MKSQLIAGILLLTAAIILQARAATTNDFSSSTNSWWVDRYTPHTFTCVPSFQSRANVLQIGINPAESLLNRPEAYQFPFYDVQGLGISAMVSSNQQWAVYGSLWVPVGVADGSAAPFASELWARTGPPLDETFADYFMVGLFLGDTNNPSNPNPVNPTVSWRVWSDDLNGAWTYLPVAVHAGWNDVGIYFDNSVVYYYLNRELVYTETSATMANPDYAAQLSVVFLAAYNGGNAYTASWSNVGDTDAPGLILPVAVRLQIALARQPAHSALLFWSNNSAGLVLQQNSNLTLSNAWANVPQDRVTNDSQIFVTVPMAANNAFFRLRKPN